MTIRNLSWWDKFLNTLTGWRTFKLPFGETINCFKDRRRPTTLGATPVNWGYNNVASEKTDPGKVGSDGVSQGTPMQLGREETRSVTWGSGYGRVNQWKTRIPLPLQGRRYWITGYPSPAFDRRCIVVGPDRIVHELIQFDQDAGVLPAGMPQQALNRGQWENGSLVDGVATTAAKLPCHAYVWGPGSMEDPHVQAFTVQDYLKGDGTTAFELNYPDGPTCGDWYYLPEDSPSYQAMARLGGQCKARVEGLSEFGARLIDRGGRSSFHTQAGAWADDTNIREFTIDLNDLRRIVQ